ncbi:hypothetical protein ACSSS7_002037 [Eimeria intestinalis]
MKTYIPCLTFALGLSCTALFNSKGAFGSRAGKGSLSSGVTDGLARLPTLAEAERRLPSTLLEGKSRLISQLREEAAVQFLSPELSSVLRAIGQVLTGDKHTSLIGQKVQLVDIEPVSSLDSGLPLSVSAIITGFLGIDDFEVSVLARLEDGGTIFVMDFFVSSEDITRHSAEVGQAFEAELSAVRKVLGSRTVAAAAEELGWAAPSYVASISGVSSTTTVDGATVHNRVFLFNQSSSPFLGDLGYALRGLRVLPLETKEYIGWRLLMLVLLLQREGIAHNDLKFRNFFMQGDGGFLLGNFEGSASFGEGITTKFFQGDTVFAEPHLALAVFKDKKRESSGENVMVASPAGDMWSLGVMLHYIFTGGLLPYWLSGSFVDDYDDYVALVRLLERDAQPDELQITLKAFEVPEQWRDLISRLLTLDSRDRLTADELLVSFPDLLHLSPSN